MAGQRESDTRPDTENGKWARNFEITNAKVIWILAAAALYLGNDFIDDIVNNPHERLDKIVAELTHVHAEQEKFSLTLNNIKRDDVECENYNIRQQASLDSLFKWKDDHTKWSQGVHEELSARIIILETISQPAYRYNNR